MSTASPQSDSRTCSSHSRTNRLSISSPSYSYSSASSSSSGSTADTSPCPSPQPRRLSKLATSTSGAKNRLSLLFHHAAPPPPPPRVSSVEEPRKVKNAHLVHVLPLGWSPDSGAGSGRGDKCPSSFLSPSTLAGPSRSARYIQTPARGHGGICKPKLVQSIEQFLLSFAYPLGSLVSGHFDSGSCTGLSSPNIYEKEHAPRRARRASTLSTPSPSTSNLTNINKPLKPVPYLLAPGIFASYAGRSDVRSRSSLPEDDLEQNHDQDTRSDPYMDTHTDPETTALTIGEIILLGALDFDHTRPGTGPGNGRAWIGDVGDVVVTGGSSDPGLSSRKGKKKECEVAVVNTDSEMMKTTKSNFNGLLTPPESLSSINSTESGDTLDDYGNRNSSTLNTRSKLLKRMSSASSIPTSPPAPSSIILKSKQTSNTSDKVKDKNSNRISGSLSSSSSTLPLPSRSPVQLPPLVIHCDSALGHRVVPPITVSTKPGSRSASGSRKGSAMIPLPTQGNDVCRSAYGKGKTRSPKKGPERKGFGVRVLRKIGLWNNTW